MSILRALLLLTALALLGCRDPRRTASTIAAEMGPTPSALLNAPTSDAPPLADDAGSAPAPLACRRPFGEPAPLALPAPFDAFTACDVLTAVLPDYKPDTESSKAAGGTVRIDRARRWDTSGRVLLAILYYQGDDADALFVCGQCRVAARVAVVERAGAALALVAKGQDPWRPNVDALFNGRPELDPAPYPFDGGETLLAMRTPWGPR